MLKFTSSNICLPPYSSKEQEIKNPPFDFSLPSNPLTYLFKKTNHLRLIRDEMTLITLLAPTISTSSDVKNSLCYHVEKSRKMPKEWRTI